MSASAVKTLALAALVLAGCGRTDGEPVARVNRETLSAPQLELLLRRQQGLTPAQQDAARRGLLERLIDQELMVQQAESQQLDREPGVRLQLEAARREVLARLMAERVGSKVAAPTAEEVARHYRDNPALYAERRVYSVQELLIEAQPAELPTLREQLGKASSWLVFREQLQAEGRRFAVNQAVRAAEQLSPPALDALSRLRDGQVAALETAGGLQVLLLSGSRAQPLDAVQAQPRIEQRLLTQRHVEAVQAELKRLREAARIEYLGAYAATPGFSGTVTVPSCGAARLRRVLSRFGVPS